MTETTSNRCGGRIIFSCLKRSHSYSATSRIWMFEQAVRLILNKCATMHAIAGVQMFLLAIGMLGLGCRKVAEKLAGWLSFMQAAGTDTTGYTMTRAVVWLCKHPEWLQALWEEQQRLIAEYGDAIDRRVRICFAMTGSFVVKWS